MDSSVIWHMARSSGIVALALLAASVIWGLILTSRPSGRRPSAASLLDLHRLLAGSAWILQSSSSTVSCSGAPRPTQRGPVPADARAAAPPGTSPTAKSTQVSATS
jgi:hypothetical protein